MPNAVKGVEKGHLLYRVGVVCVSRKDSVCVTKRECVSRKEKETVCKSSTHMRARRDARGQTT